MEDEKSASMDQITNQNGFHAERPDTNDDSVTLIEKSINTSTNSPEAKPAKGLVFFHLLVPIVIMAFYYTGLIKSIIHETYSLSPFSDYDYLILQSICLFWPVVHISPLFCLLAIWRSFSRLPRTRVKKTICSIILLSIWVILFTHYVDIRPLGESLKLIFKNYELINAVYISLFLLAMIKACIAIFSYEKSKHSVVIDVISSTALCAAYYIIFYYLIR